MSIENINREKDWLPVDNFLDIKDLIIPQGEELIEAILNLKKEKKAVIFAHNSEVIEIQSIADVSGNSYQLASQAKKDIDADMIVFCGNNLMAAILKILNSTKKVLFSKNDSVLDTQELMVDSLLEEIKKDIDLKEYLEDSGNGQSTLENLYLCIKYELPEINIDEDFISKALVPIEKSLGHLEKTKL